MSFDPKDNPFPDGRPRSGHSIEMESNTGVILRDGKPVAVRRIGENTIKVGCTVVTYTALKRLIELYDKKDILQDGVE